MSISGIKREGVAFHNRLSDLVLSEVGDAPCGCCFGYFILDKQNKVTRQSRESDRPQSATIFHQAKIDD